MRASSQNLVSVLLLLAALSASSVLAQPVNWRIDPLHSSAQFSVRHMMISTVRGQFGGIKGTVTYEAKDPALSTVEATIDCTTVNTGEAKRDADLKSKVFRRDASSGNEVQVQDCCGARSGETQDDRGFDHQRDHAAGGS